MTVKELLYAGTVQYGNEVIPVIVPAPKEEIRSIDSVAVMILDGRRVIGRDIADIRRQVLGYNLPKIPETESYIPNVQQNAHISTLVQIPIQGNWMECIPSREELDEACRRRDVAERTEKRMEEKKKYSRRIPGYLKAGYRKQTPAPVRTAIREKVIAPIVRAFKSKTTLKSDKPSQ